MEIVVHLSLMSDHLKLNLICFSDDEERLVQELFHQCECLALDLCDINLVLRLRNTSDVPLSCLPVLLGVARVSVLEHRHAVSEDVCINKVCDCLLLSSVRKPVAIHDVSNRVIGYAGLEMVGQTHCIRPGSKLDGGSNSSPLETEFDWIWYLGVDLAHIIQRGRFWRSFDQRHLGCCWCLLIQGRLLLLLLLLLLLSLSLSLSLLCLRLLVHHCLKIIVLLCLQRRGSLGKLRYKLLRLSALLIQCLLKGLKLRLLLRREVVHGLGDSSH